jgi:predicted amidohydrolase YtcJ
LDDRAELIVTGATLHTVDANTAGAQAFTVSDGRFDFIGSESEALQRRGPRTERHDLRGRTVLPGFIDAHVHLTLLGLASEGDGWALTRDRHAVVANAAALRRAGITAQTPDPPGGRIERDSSGNPTGVLLDNAMRLITAHEPTPTREHLIDAVRHGVAECSRYGVTSIAEAGVTSAYLDAQRALLERGEFYLRNHAMVLEPEEPLDEYFSRGPIVGAYDGRLSVRAVKMFADGALGTRGAALLAPYCDDEANSGIVVADSGRVRDVTEAALRAGFQVCTHAIGDRANRLVLDAYEAALQVAPTNDHRLRIEHAQMLAQPDIPRFARLGVIASVQTSHRTSDAEMAPSRIGSDRMKGAYAWRALLDSGARIANGTDAPIESVSTSRTFLAALAGLSRGEALKAMTTWAAYANFMEHEVGSIAPGKRADFVVLDCDWMSASLKEIAATNVLATYLGGDRVYGA